jgi:hypothetical protein
MRDRVADRSFLLQKRVENLLENAFESKFRSGYSMVCYGSTTGRNVTYHKALVLGKVQVSSATCSMEGVRCANGCLLWCMV